jgi:hypothetical protein
MGEIYYDGDIIPSLEGLEITSKIMAEYEKYTPSGGFILLYCLIAVLSGILNRGRGVIIVSKMGSGKGRAEKTVFRLFEGKPYKLFKRYESLKAHALTQKGIIDYIDDFNLKNPNMAIMLEDLSIASNKSYLLADTLNVTASMIADKYVSLVTDDNYGKNRGKKKKDKSYSKDINSCSVLLGATNSLMARIKSIEAYNTMYRDRVSELYHYITKLQYFRLEDEICLDTYGTHQLNEDDLRERIKKLLPLNFKMPSGILPIKASKKMLKFVWHNLYNRQHSITRGYPYFKTDLSILASLNGRDYISSNDIAFYHLYYPNLCLSRCNPIIQAIAQNILSCEDTNDLCNKLFLSKQVIYDAYIDQERENEYDLPIIRKRYKQEYCLKDKIKRFIDMQEEFLDEAQDL